MIWIRTQDRKRLIKVNDINIITLTHGDEYGKVFGYNTLAITEDEMDGEYELGKYDTHKRTFEVLDDIQKSIEVQDCTQNMIYEMPIE